MDHASDIEFVGFKGFCLPLYTKSGQIVETTQTKIGKSDFTISAWVLVKNRPDKNNWSIIISKDRSGDGNCQFRIQLHPDLHISVQGLGIKEYGQGMPWPHSYYKSEFGGWASELNSLQPLPLQSWTHFALVRKRLTIQLFINGQQAVSVKTTEVFDHSNGHKFRVGSRFPPSGNAPDHPFDGEIDGVAFFNRAFSHFQVHELYRTQVYRTSTTKGTMNLNLWLKQWELESIESQLKELGATDVSSLTRFPKEKLDQFKVITRSKLIHAIDCYITERPNDIPKEETGNDIFFLYSKSTGEENANIVIDHLMKLRPDLKIIAEGVESTSSPSKINELLSCRNFILFLTAQTIRLSAIQEYCAVAVNHKKKLILVHDEKNCFFPSGAETADISEETKTVLYVKAVPYINLNRFRDVSIDMIAEKLD